ncbi:hypothetical protein PHYSODRAFT_524279 [Phytophthora sojae]|uniref:Uncharacterized protein n=1 Tax=Phytophthora sojae (strain P6497) TaxID=1094619 RepID=G5A5S2_PHYSP|nr:hypothetical protein PHYSODRAFT_524279 [Phytophthora sojae]EGZ08677.1 hypothetical protein PHYSODRAFT_524279 [Phytophthora sojae]|eukprot:XP_009535310.1 hypothetical protein PHYSODRAFT_524279 [Phytophthora sojae]
MTTPSPVPTPSQLDVARPIVHRRGQSTRSDDDEDARFMAMVRLSLEQEWQRADEQRIRWEQERHEERARREEERARREEDREAERRQRQEDREEDRRRHQELLSLLLIGSN